jgi:hypothetical protein
MEGLTTFDSEWGRHVGLTVVGWLLVSAVAIMLLLTVVQNLLA